MSATIYYYKNDMTLRLSGLVDAQGAPVTTAVVQLTELKDCDDETPAGIVLPLTLAHVDDGTYEGPLEDTLDVEVGDVLTGTIVATAAAGVATWTETIIVRRRTA